MAQIFEITGIRERKIKLAKLRAADLDYLLPASLMRTIDELNLGGLDDLLNGHQKFFIFR
jgi:hypothetical protein